MAAERDIEACLSATEHEAGITIIGAWNTGSRAWGLAGPESDYDITFVFTQPLTQYATNTKYIESLELTPEETMEADRFESLDARHIEGSGWDAKRFLELLGDTNPAAIEAIHSPIAYRPHPILDDVSKYVSKSFNIIDAFLHYKSMGESIYGEIESGETTAKRNLMTIRACMYAEYIRTEHAFPALDFPTFLDEQASQTEGDWDIGTIRELVTLKTNGKGDADVGNPQRKHIERLINSTLEDPEAHVRPPENRLDAEALDRYMQELLSSRTLFQ